MQGFELRLVYGKFRIRASQCFQPLEYAREPTVVNVLMP